MKSAEGLLGTQERETGRCVDDDTTAGLGGGMGQREVLRYLARLWEEARIRSAVVHEWDIFERVCVCVAIVHDRPRNVRFPGRDSPAAIVKQQLRHTPAGGNRQFSFPTH